MSVLGKNRNVLPGLLLLAGLMMIGPGCSGLASSATDRDIEVSKTHYRIAADHLSNRRALEARRELNKSLKKNPKNRHAHKLLGIIDFMEGVYKSSLVDRVQCLKGAEADEQRAVSNIDFRKAEGRFKRAVELAKAEEEYGSESLVYLANTAIHFKRYKEAIKFIDQALLDDLYRDHHLALSVKGWAIYKQGKLKEAAQILRQANYARANFCIGLYRLGKIYYDKKAYSRTVTELEKIKELKKCPLQEVPHLLGMAYTHTGAAREKVRKQFELCIQINRKSCLARECTRLLKNVAPAAAVSESAEKPVVEAKD